MPSPARPSIDLPRSDREEAELARQSQQNAAQFALDQVGGLLSQADRTLAEITDQDMLGTAIVRGCKDLADGIGQLANQMDQQSHEERRALAQACIQDAQASLLLMDNDANDDSAGASLTTTDSPTADALYRQQSSSTEELANNLSEDQVMGAIQAAAILLRDVEVTLRAIDRDEAEEIADVALTVARIFIASLQSVHATLTPDHLIQQPDGNAAGGGSSNARRSGPRIDLLDSDDDEDGTTTPSSHRPNLPQTSSTGSTRNNDRLRVLWPPLGPAVSTSLDWGKEAATQKPLLAVALGLTLWPWAVVTALVATPLVLVDGFVQQAYGNFQDGPIILGVELTAAQIYQTGRLSFLCSKLFVRQTLRVASRQVNRHGGVGQIASHIGAFALDRMSHPVETASMVWDGVTWGVDMVVGAWQHLNDHEQDETVQRLQQ